MRKIFIIISFGMSVASLLVIFYKPFFDLFCAYYCPNLLGIASAVFGFSFISLFKPIKFERNYRIYLCMLIIDILIYILFPDYTDYILPSKDFGIFIFNLVIPVIFLAFSLLKKNKRMSISRIK